MESKRLQVSFKASADEDARKDGDTMEYETTIIFEGWTDQDFMIAAARPVIIGQLQPRARKGKDIPSEYVASRPGTKGVRVLDYYKTLCEAIGKELADKAVTKFGNAKDAVKAIKGLLD